MKSKMKLISYGLAVLVIVIICVFVYKCFFDIMNNGIFISLENSRLGGLFQTFKLLFIFVNLVGIIICVFLLVKNIRQLNKYLLGIVFFNLLYSLVTFLWVINAAKSPEILAQTIVSYMQNLSSGGSEELTNLGIQTASATVFRQIYLLNIYNAFIMAIPTLILIFLKYIVDKKIRNFSVEKMIET